MISWWQYIQIWLYLGFNHQRRKCEGSPPKYLWPISYFGSIWELYVLDLKTKVFCRKKNQLHFSHGQGHELRTLGEEIAFTERPKIHSHSQTFRSGWSIFCLPHRPKFSDFFDLCLHWVSVVRGQGTHSAKTVLAVWPKIPKIPQKISAQFVCPSPKVSNFRKKALSGCP